jgi:hypothetical protein
MIESTRYFPSNTVPRSMDLTEVTSAHGNPNPHPPTKNQGAHEVTKKNGTVREVESPPTTPEKTRKKWRGAAARRHCTP